MNAIKRITAMGNHNTELIERLAKKPEVVGIIAHGSFSDNPRHETDATSDLDLTVVIDAGAHKSDCSDPRVYIPWLNFKSYQAIDDSNKPLEVDMYYFDMVNDTRPWSLAAKEGYAYSATVVYDPTGKVNEWMNRNTDLTPELRYNAISQQMCNAAQFFSLAVNSTTQVDKRVMFTKATKSLVEVVFLINWEYAPDLKWRVSGSQHVDISWKPHDFISFLGKCNETSNLEEMKEYVQKLFDEVSEKLAEEDLAWNTPTFKETSKPSIDRVTRIARLFTRIDKYSAHSVKKCVHRGLPWNAHDLVSEGVENAIDIIYAINNAPIPVTDKYLGLKDLPWKPKGMNRYLSAASKVINYESSDDALERAEALRKLFEGIREKVAEMEIFSISSLYDRDFMYQDLFGENSPYMLVFKGGQYQNRQQERDTFAELICKKVNLPNYEKNILFGMCSHYLISDEVELMELDPENMHPYYRPTWEVVVKQLKNN